MRGLWAGAVLVIACDGAVVEPDAGRDALVAPPPAHATLSWRMRCDEGLCPAEAAPVRTIDADDGEDGHTIACDLTLEDGRRRFELTARRGSEYGVDIGGAFIDSSGVRIMGSLCRMRVFEEADDDLLAACSSNLPTADTPCQLQRIDIVDEGGAQHLLAELRCVDAPVDGSETELRDVTSPTAASGYAELRFTGCEGLR